MGNWTIVIKGVGCHHNPNLPTDADRMAAEFVKRLREASHTVTHAAITHGGETDLSCPTIYLDNRSENKGPRCDKEIIHDGNEHRCGLVEKHEGLCRPVTRY